MIEYFACLWYKAAQYHKNEIHDEHPWVECRDCKDFYNAEKKCDNYKSEHTINSKLFEKNFRKQYIQEVADLVGEVYRDNS